MLTVTSRYVTSDYVDLLQRHQALPPYSLIMLQPDGTEHQVRLHSDALSVYAYWKLEILLGSTIYTRGVDIWAVGAILGEMLNGRPIFPGTNTMNQVERIIEVINMPSKTDIESIASPYSATMLESLPTLNYKMLSEVFPTATSEAIDLIRSCFHFNPNRRPSSEQLLQHVFVAEFHNEEEEPIYPHGPLRLPIDDNVKLTAPQYRERLYQEITNRRRDSRKKDQTQRTRKLSNASNTTS